MSDELNFYRRVQKAKAILLSEDHLGHQRLVDELDSWIDMDNDLPEFIDGDPTPPHGIARPPARLIRPALP